MGDLPHSQKTRWGERTRLLLHHVRLHWSHKCWDCSLRWANTLVARTSKNWRWLVVLCPSSNGYKWDETSTKLHGNRKFFTSLNYFDLIKRALIGNLTVFFLEITISLKCTLSSFMEITISSFMEITISL